jgi:hypothetical protein
VTDGSYGARAGRIAREKELVALVWFNSTLFHAYPARSALCADKQAACFCTIWTSANHFQFRTTVRGRIPERARRQGMADPNLGPPAGTLGRRVQEPIMESARGTMHDVHHSGYRSPGGHPGMLRQLRNRPCHRGRNASSLYGTHPVTWAPRLRATGSDTVCTIAFAILAPPILEGSIGFA